MKPLERARGSVRMGPISLFVLIMTLCLAVLAVLAFTTAHAQKSITERQVQMVTATYKSDSVAANLLADLDDALANAKAARVSHAVTLKEVQGFLDKFQKDSLLEYGVSCETSMKDSVAEVFFKQNDGRTLKIRFSITNDYKYLLLAWITGTDWEEPGSGNILWEG